MMLTGRGGRFKHRPYGDGRRCPRDCRLSTSTSNFHRGGCPSWKWIGSRPGMRSASSISAVRLPRRLALARGCELDELWRTRGEIECQPDRLAVPVAEDRQHERDQ